MHIILTWSLWAVLGFAQVGRLGAPLGTKKPSSN